MVQIIPAIIAKDFEDLKNKVEAVKGVVGLVQLDVMDGVFVPNKTFGEPAAVEKISSMDWEIHLMVGENLSAIKSWSKITNVKRIIFHWESAKNEKKLEECVNSAKQAGKEVGLALNPGTNLAVLDKWLPKIDLVLLMAVNPGTAGQEFMGEVIPKIKTLRREWIGGKIEVDGGVNSATAKKIIEAGADFLAVGSFIFDSPQPKEQIKTLKSTNH